MVEPCSALLKAACSAASTAFGSAERPKVPPNDKAWATTENTSGLGSEQKDLPETMMARCLASTDTMCRSGPEIGSCLNTYLEHPLAATANTPAILHNSTRGKK